MKKIAVSGFSLLFFVSFSFAQAKGVVYKAATDPKREAAAAKAGVWIQDKTVVSDDQPAKPVADRGKKAKRGLKSKSCKKSS